MRSKVSVSSLVWLMAIPGIGLFWLLKQRGSMDIWNALLLGTGIVYLVTVSQSFQNFYFGFVVAHVSFVSTLLWYSIIASEIGKPEEFDARGGYPVASVFAAVCIPVIVFQIVASGSRIFGNVNVDPCTPLMRSWLAIVICLSMVLLFGRASFWRELNWFEVSHEEKSMEETTLWYMVMAFVAAMIYPFFLSDFPNPIRILFCIFHH